MALNKRRRKSSKNGKQLFVAPSIKPSRIVTARYRRDMNHLIRQMNHDVMTVILPFLITNQKEFVADASFSLRLRDLINGVKRKYRDITPIATVIATTAVGGEAKNNTTKFEKGVERITGGVSLGRIIGEGGLQDVLQTQIATNVDLIQSIPDQYFKQISTAIYQGVASGDQVGSLTKQIQHIAGTTESRAKLIARDQTQKTNALVTQQRQLDLGVEEYVWQTAGDGPPRTRQSHWVKQGKTFRWDDPPKDTGHPGNDINCRCTARAVIEL